MKQIVFGSANHWTSPYQVGSHAWARLFSRNQWNVCYISDPITPWHRLGGANSDRFRERFELWKKKGTVDQQGFFSWVPLSLMAPANQSAFRSEWVLKNWHHGCYPSLKSVVSKFHDGSPDVFWLDSVRHYFWAKKVRSRLLVYRMADWTAGFPGVPQSILNLEKEVIQKADLVITSALTLAERIKEWRGKRPMVTIQNGVDLAFWKERVAPPDSLREIPKPYVVYVGALDEWFDFELLFQMARALPKLSFLIIGQLKKDLDKSQKPSNIYFLGSMPREKVRGYVQQAQVGIIPFKRNELIECVCPLKLYEYMACGIPVIATCWEELERMKSPAFLVSTPEEWIGKLKVFESKTNPTQENTPFKGTDDKPVMPPNPLIDYAFENDWSQRWLQWLKWYETVSTSN